MVDDAAQFNVVPKTIRYLHNRYAQTDHVKDRSRSGRPKVTNPRQDNFMTYILHNGFATSKEVHQALQNVVPAGRQFTNILVLPLDPNPIKGKAKINHF